MFAPGGRLLLHANERITVPFKYLQLAADAPVMPRTIRASFVMTVTGGLRDTTPTTEHNLALLEVTVQPRLLTVDRVVRIEARENEVLRRRVMLPDQQTAPARVWCSDGEIIVTPATLPRSGAGAIDFKCRLGNAPSQREFTLVLSDDQFMGRVREVWRVIVCSRQWLDVRATAGQPGKTSVVLRSGNSARRVTAFCSRPDMITVRCVWSSCTRKSLL